MCHGRVSLFRGLGIAPKSSFLAGCGADEGSSDVSIEMSSFTMYLCSALVYCSYFNLLMEIHHFVEVVYSSLARMYRNFLFHRNIHLKREVA